MRPIAPHEILNVYDYEKVRDARRRAVIEQKAVRRVQVGRHVSFVFENRETVWFQIQEMCRAERIVADDKIAEEVAGNNALLPASSELAATMLIEIEDPAQIKPVLDKLLGIDSRNYVRLKAGPYTIVGAFETGHSDEERGKISAVHFVRFPLPVEAQRNFEQYEVTLVVDHPNEHARTILSVETKRSLARDLT